MLLKQILFSVGNLHIYGYGLMIAVGIMVAYFVIEHRAKKQNINPDKVFSLLIWCLVGGVLGSKLLYCLTQIKTVLQMPSLLWNLSSGWVLYGGILGGIFAGWICCKVQKMPFWQQFDLVIPSVALAQGFGRIGCFLAGCCYGKPTDSVLGVVFPDSGIAPAGQALIPTQLISAGLDFLLFVFLIWYSARKRVAGQVAGLYLLLYGIGRFVLEYFRGDFERGAVLTLSTSQFISLFVVAFGVLVLALRHPKKPVAPSM